MTIKKITLFLLLLTFLSGTFTLNRLNLGISLDVRYLLLFFLMLILLIGLTKNKELIKIKINNGKFFFLFATFSYFFFSALSLFYTVNQLQSFEKFNSLIFLSLLVFFLILIVNYIEPTEFYKSISYFFITFGIIYAMPVILSVLLGAHRGDVILSGPNVTTRILFFAVCSSIYLYLLNKKNLYFILMLLFMASIILVGSRGGVVGAAIIISLLFTVKNISKIKEIKIGTSITYKKILIIPLALGILFFIYKPVERVFLDRIIGVTFNDNGVYTSGRDTIYAKAIDMIQQKPLLGYGIDSFTHYTGQVYPHNLLLEMMLEVGVIGAIIFIVFLIFALRFIYLMRNSSFFIFSGLPLYMIIVQMFSGEFYDFRYYFLWSIPLLQYRSIREFELKNKIQKSLTELRTKKIERNGY